MTRNKSSLIEDESLQVSLNVFLRFIYEISSESSCTPVSITCFLSFFSTSKVIVPFDTVAATACGRKLAEKNLSVG